MTNWVSCDRCGTVNEVKERTGDFRGMYQTCSCACGYTWDTEPEGE